MVLLPGLLIVSFFALIDASPTARDKVVHERRDVIPEGFVLTGTPPGEHVLNLRINLASNNLPGLETALNGASDPLSPTFRRWLAKDEVHSFTKPSNETIDAVDQWLSTNGLSAKPVSSAGDWIEFSVPAGRANALFDTSFSVYTHEASGQQSIRALQYSIPVDLQPHVKLVYPITSFSGTLRSAPVMSFPSSVTPRAAPAASCDSTITPTCLQELYNIPSAAATNEDNGIGVAGFGNQFANLVDLQMFLKAQRPDMPPNTSFTLMSVDGGENEQVPIQAGLEASLDIQYTVGLATDVPVTFVSVGQRYKDGADDGFLDIITALLAMDAPPQVLTTSYGFSTENSLSPSLTMALCTQYMALTARGVSILFASGDGGVAATPGISCDSQKFMATFPTCPYVTLVGATQNVPEQGADLTAGGFSNIFPTPSFQTNAVEGYLKTLGSQYSGAYNASGRAYPDVSAQGQRLEIIQSAKSGTTYGTSCSSPIFASVIGLINDDLLNVGKPPLGFLNPWLYANPTMFNDITTGSNPGCGTNGFPAAAGWDPVTGLGTPNFTAMRAAAGL